MTTTSTNPGYLAKLAKNQSQPCIGKSCHVPRAGLDVTCARHRNNYKRHGAVDAHSLPRKLWKLHRAKVEALLLVNVHHLGLLEADRIVAEFMHRGANASNAFRGANEMARLMQSGVAPRTVLVEVLALMACLRDFPSAVPTDKATDHAISHAVFRLAPQSVRSGWNGARVAAYRGRPRASALAYVGRFLRIALAEFGATVQLAIEAKARAAAMTDEDRRAARTAPMRIA